MSRVLYNEKGEPTGFSGIPGHYQQETIPVDEEKHEYVDARALPLEEFSVSEGEDDLETPPPSPIRQRRRR